MSSGNMLAYVTRPLSGTGGGTACFAVEVGPLFASLGMLPVEVGVSPTEADAPPTEADASPTEADARFDWVRWALLFDFLFWARAC